MPYEDDRLRQLMERVARKRTLETRAAELRRRLEELELRVDQLRYQMEKEQYDVDKLEGGSLAAFFYGVVGKMDEKLTREREEAYAARVKYDAAALELRTAADELQRLETELAGLAGCEEAYQDLLRRKAEELKRAGGPAGRRLLELEQRLAFLRHQEKELGEAAAAGQQALSGADAVLNKLSSAKGWATWDVLGGGMLSDIAKYSNLDEAQYLVQQLQLQLDRFKTELADVTIETDLRVSVDGFLRFADYFFDNLFTDWAVMDQIGQAQSQVSRTRAQIVSVLQGLDIMTGQARQESARLREERDQLVRQAAGGYSGLN